MGADTDLDGWGGADQIRSSSHDSSGASDDGYTTASLFPLPDAELGLTRLDLLDGSSSVLKLHGGVLSGDYVTYSVCGDGVVGLFVAAPDDSGGPELAQVFLSWLGQPIVPILPVLPLPWSNATGTASSIWIAGDYPYTAGNLTLNLVALTATVGVTGSVRISNEVTIRSGPSECDVIPSYSYDDGTFESGWVVAIPSGSSDYFNVNHGVAPQGLHLVQRLAVMDFGTAVSSFPSSGFAPPNTSLDPSEKTPDLSIPYFDQPFSFPALTFSSTYSGMVESTSCVPVDSSFHGFVQFPPGDLGLLNVGADTNATFISGLSGWTLDGFATPSNLFGVNWGMQARGFWDCPHCQ